MITFITFLKAIAACLITNSHYTGIYPTDLIANGGLFGDVIFFAISGYCLYNIKDSFVKWYSKRIIRIYVPVLIITLFYLLIGSYSLNGDLRNLITLFLYPTYYHFVASIIILYIPYYIIVQNKYLRDNMIWVIAIIGICALGVYFFAYNKSYYHIDNVHETMIKFLFMEAMLIGAIFRKNDSDYRNVSKKNINIITSLLVILYFGSKIVFTKISVLTYWQFINQIILLILLFYVMRLFSSLDEKLEKSNMIIMKLASFISNITLEIYCVQYVIIDCIKLCDISFPINWIIVSSLILVLATILHFISRPLVDFIQNFTVNKLERTK